MLLAKAVSSPLPDINIYRAHSPDAFTYQLPEYALPNDEVRVPQKPDPTKHNRD